MPARDTATPLLLEPQLCTSSPETHEGDTSLHEIKYDGWRMMARKQGNQVRLFTPGGHEWSAKLPRLRAAIAALSARSAWLGGELPYFDEQGYPQFEAPAGATRSGDERRLCFQVSDLPWCSGRDFSALPLLERKARLKETIGNGDTRIRYSDHMIGNGGAFFRQADAMNLEGIVSKRIESRYHRG